MRSAVIVHGKQGSGKSLFFEQVMLRLYGDYGVQASQFDLESQYTGWLSRKLFVLFNEIHFTIKKSLSPYSQLKSLITDDSILVREKYQVARTEQNCASFVFLSNSLDPTLIETDDRRYTVLYVGSNQNHEYYQELATEINTGGLAAFYQYLLDYDTAGFDAHVKPCESDAKNEIIAAVRDSAESFVAEWESGETCYPRHSCEVDQLWQAYRLWCHEHEYHDIKSKISFGRLLKSRGYQVVMLGHFNTRYWDLDIGDSGDPARIIQWAGQFAMYYQERLRQYQKL